MKKFRFRGMTLVRYLVIILIAVFITSLITDFRVVEAERTGCERRQPIFTTINGILIDAQAQAEKKNKVVEINGKKINVAQYYQERIDLIQSLIVEDCDEVYPYIIPLPID